MKYLLPKGEYKSVDKYAEAVYKLNTASINEKLDIGEGDRLIANKMYTKNSTMFKEQIKMEYNMYRYDPTYNKYTDRQLMKRATETVFNSEAYTPASERLASNFLTGIKRNDQALYRAIRNAARDELGHYQSIDPSEIVYDSALATEYGALAAYHYRDMTIILKQSPAEYIVL